MRERVMVDLSADIAAWSRASTAPAPTPARVRLLGQVMDLVTAGEVMARIAHWVGRRERRIVANHNLHSLYLVRHDARMRDFYARVDLVEVDSTPLIKFGRALGLPMRAEHRCTYLDWREDFWRLAARERWRVAYVGGADGVAATAAQRIAARHAGVNLLPVSGYFDAAAGSADNAEVLDRLDAFDPHILMVGMGMPRQEAWIADNLEALPSAVILPVGAAFDYEAGVQRAAPRWMGRAGLEWAFRLVADPRRLFVRYCIEPWFLIGPALADVTAAVGRRA